MEDLKIDNDLAGEGCLEDRLSSLEFIKSSGEAADFGMPF